MLLECESCGAPLDVKEGVSVVRCAYCGRNAELSQYRKVAPVTPAEFVPPKEWTPPSSVAGAGRPLRYRPHRSAVRGVFTSLFMTAAIGGFVAWQVRNAGQPTAPTPTNQTKTMIGDALNVVSAAVDLAKAKHAANQQIITGDALPIVCNGHDDVTLMGKTISSETVVPIIASGNCTMKLVGCAVSGTTAITANGNAKVVVEGGSLAGKGPAVVLSGNAELDVSGGAHLTGDLTITATANTRARIRESDITGTHIAVQATGNATVDTTGSVVHGKVGGFRHR
jgi:LSD1 subclass zinc finger protein